MASSRTNRHGHPGSRAARTALFLVLLAILAAALTSCGDSNEPTITTEPITSTAQDEDVEGDSADEAASPAIPEGAVTMAVGEQFQAGPFSVRVVSAGNLDIDSVGVPDEGYRWLGIDVVVVNTSVLELSIDTYPYPVENVRVDAGGEVADGWLITGFGQNVTSTGFFPPGDETQVTYGYEVPIGEEDLTLVMEPIASGAPTVVVPLTE
jgi:hypothetical protein